MDKFFKSIKDNLENREAPDFNPAAWENMKSKMAPVPVAPVKSPISKWIPLLALLLVGSTVLNYWFYSNSNNINVNSNNTSFTHQIDTILQTNVVYKTDTIFQTKYITQNTTIETVSNNTSNTTKKSLAPVANYNTNFHTGRINSEFTHHTLNNDSEPKFENRFVSNQDFKNSATPDLLSDSFIRESEKDQKEANAKQLGNKRFSNFKSITNNTLAFLNPPTPALELEYVDVRLTKYRKSLNQMIYPMRPKGFKLGIAGGIIRPIGKDLESNFKYIMGIEPSIVFSKNLELFGDVSFFKTEFETEKMDAAIGVPMISPENEEVTFNEAELSQDILQVGIGMKYLFANTTKFSPYIGVGFYGLKISNYTVKYEFENDDNGTGGGNNEDDEEEIIKNYNEGILKNQLIFRSGLDYQILKKWSIQLDAFYRQNLSENILYTPNNFGFKTGIYRKF